MRKKLPHITNHWIVKKFKSHFLNIFIWDIEVTNNLGVDYQLIENHC